MGVRVGMGGGGEAATGECVRERARAFVFLAPNCLIFGISDSSNAWNASELSFRFVGFAT